MPLLALACYLALGLNSLAGLTVDDGVYLTTSQALSQGQGYRMVSLPQAPFVISFPPLYPLVIAPLWWLFPQYPDGLWAIKGLNVLLVLVATVLTVRLAHRVCGLPRGLAVLAGGLFALSTPVAMFTNVAMSELTYCALVLLAFNVLEPLIERRGPAQWRWLFLGGGVAALAVLTRTAGAFIGFGAIGLLLLQRRWKDAGGFAAGWVLVQLPWQWWIDHIRRAGLPASWNYTSWLVDQSGGFSPAVLASTVQFNAQGIIGGVQSSIAMITGDHFIIGKLAPLGLAWLLGVGFFLAAAVMLVGFVATWRRQLRLFHLFVPLSLLVILLYPKGDPARYVFPLAPFFFIGMVAGCQVLWRGARWPRALVLARAIAVSVVLVAVGEGAYQGAHMLKHGRFNDDRLAATTRAWLSDQRDLGDWLRTHAPPDAQVATYHGHVLYMLSGRQVIVYAGGADPAASDIENFVRRPSYLAVSAVDPWAPAMKALIEHHAERVQLVYRTPAGQYSLYRVSGDWPAP